MDGIILAFESTKNGARIKDILERGGFSVNAVCRSGAEAKRSAMRFNSGVLVCGFKLTDMPAEELFYDLPEGFAMLMVASQEQLDICEQDDIFKLPTPITGQDLVASVRMLMQISARSRPVKVPPQKRSGDDMEIINKAKALLIDRHGMTEGQAHRFIQKKSMDMGAKMVQTAKLVLGDHFL